MPASTSTLTSVIGGPKYWAYYFALATVAGLFLAFLGAFDSYRMPLERRLLGFIGIGWMTAPVFFPLLRLGLQLGQRWGLSIWLAAPLASAAATIPVALIVCLTASLLFFGVFMFAPFDVVYFQMLAVNVPIPVALIILRRIWAAPAGQGLTLATAPATGGAVALEPAPRETLEEHSGGAPEGRPRLRDRLPPGFGDILALQAEDHYVRVHSPTGSTLLLMRLADAVAELDGLDGLQVHRSWWVAKAAVASAARDGRRVNLRLTNGAEAPVTRENIRALRQAGWI
jgi:hypothetical protein